MTGEGPFKREWIITVLGAYNDKGGASIYDLAEDVNLTPATLRQHLRQLIRDGLVTRNQERGRGVRYFLAELHRPKVWAVIINDKGKELGRVELPERMLDDDGTSDRRMRVLGKQLQAIMRRR